MANIMVVVQWEQLDRTYGEARKDRPPPNHTCGMLVRYKDVFTNVLLKMLPPMNECNFAQEEIEFLRHVVTKEVGGQT